MRDCLGTPASMGSSSTVDGSAERADDSEGCVGAVERGRGGTACTRSSCETDGGVMAWTLGGMWVAARIRHVRHMLYIKDTFKCEHILRMRFGADVDCERVFEREPRGGARKPESSISSSFNREGEEQKEKEKEKER